MKWFVMALALLLGSCGNSGAPEITVSEAWARPTLTPTQPGAVYLNIANSGKVGDRLQAVSSDRGRASLHSSALEGSVVRMRPMAAGVAIPAESTFELKPNGAHIMLEGLSDPLKAGTHFQLTLQFEASDDRQVQVQVANGPSEMHGGHR